MGREVHRKAGRKLRARAQGRRGIWFGLGMFGVIGWSVAVPAVAFTALGVWLDRHWPADFSWTLTLLFIGVGVGCLNAWYWVREHTRPEDAEDETR
ncbi:ATPase F0F1 [Dissulfurirhabdus thermomarina]|uniref:ATPase F0F1 n=1 Tax=Dissulfurirhabdus thermomarina TaxID=1765737 RepID=A0A6N9TNF3_DISTH|nr:AtpZ/AtpI family protein [Dissulfurirhabdus thermomarina]NDY41613.1 ATPase F0F1 [Dissulfurirhabdus thermomarina]NMX23344.1 ATPase F0F1 [Dissulfurirhabdus thermomarina]